MELFKTTVLKSEYKEFSTKLLPKVLECNYCNIISCQYHSKFDGTCTHCRQRHCKNCKTFNISKEILFNSANEETVDYLINYISDFLNLSDLMIKTYFPEIKIEKSELINFRKIVKSEKNRTQVVNCAIPSNLRQGSYQNGRWKRSFFC